MKNTNNGNVFLFPHLMERYLDIALEAKEAGDFHKAKESLEEALRLDHDYAPAMLGLVVTYYELKMYREASELAEYMLYEGLGEYSEVLQLYVVILIQLEEYDRVCEILAKALDDSKLSAARYSELEEIYHTCSLLSEALVQEQEEPIIKAKVEEKMVTDEQFLNQLINELDVGDFDRQLQVIEQLKYAKDAKVIEALRNYCILPHVDPVLKTFALRALKFLGETERVFVYKFDQLLETSLDRIPADEDGLREDQRKVIELLGKQTYHEDPMFVTFAMQIWMEYLFAAFPLIPSLRHTASWAAALHSVVRNLLGHNVSRTEIAEKYGTTVQTITKRVQSIEQVLPLKKRHLSSQHLPFKSH